MLLRSKLRGRNRIMNQLIASVEDRLRIPLADAQAVFRALAATGVYGELVVGSDGRRSDSRTGSATCSSPS